MQWFKVFPAVVTNPKYYRLSETGRGLLLHLWISAANEGPTGELDADYWDCESLFRAAGVRPENEEHAKEQLRKILEFGWFEKTANGRAAPKNWDIYQACPVSDRDRKRSQRERELSAKKSDTSAIVVTDSVTHVTDTGHDVTRDGLHCIALHSIAGEESPLSEPSVATTRSAVAVKPKRANRGAECHPDALPLSRYLLAQMLEVKADSKQPIGSVFESWVCDMDKILRLDNRDPDRVADVIKFATHDSFQRTNIRCPKKLREKFDTLELQMNSPGKNPTRAPEPCVDYPDLAVVGKAEGWYRETTTKKLSITGENC
jgi:hypothetical protein